MTDRLTVFRRQLEDFAPVDDTAHSSFFTLLESGIDPFDEYRADPGHITASGFVLSPDATALLLIHHRRLDMWLQPGGHVDPSDADIEAAARREIAEETAAVDIAVEHDGIFDLDVHPIPKRPAMAAHHHYDVSFLFRAASWSMAASPEVRDARWVPLDAARQLSNDRPLHRVLARLGIG